MLDTSKCHIFFILFSRIYSAASNLIDFIRLNLKMLLGIAESLYGISF